jgi:HEAT repeat protein
VEALSRTGDARATKAVVAAVKDADSTVRVAAVDALTEVHDAQVAQILVVSLKDKDQYVRASAASVLGKIGDAKAVEPLLSVLKDGNWAVRKAAVEALGRLKDPRAVEPLAVLLKDPDHDVREVTVTALGEIGDPRAVERLVLSLADAQSSVRQLATAALRKIDNAWEKSEAARRTIPDLKVALQSNEYWVRHSAAEVLAKLDKTRAVQPQFAAMDTAIRLRHQVAVDALLNALGDYDSDLRLAAAEALGRIGDARLAKPLTGRLTDANPWVRQAAARALERMGWKPADESELARHQAALQSQPMSR